MNYNTTPFAMSHGVVDAVDGDEYDMEPLDDEHYEQTPVDKAQITLNEARGSVGRALGSSRDGSRLDKYIGGAQQTLDVLTMLRCYSPTKVETAQQMLAASRQANIAMLQSVKASLDNAARLADEQALAEVGRAYQSLARAEYEVSVAASYLMQKITAHAEREARQLTKQAQQAMADLAETLREEA